MFIGDIVDNSIREKYSSFASIMYSIEYITKSYYKNIDISKINLSKDYNSIKSDNYKMLLNKVDDRIDTLDIDITREVEENKSFSKKSNHLITKEENDRLEEGKRVHSLFELTSFDDISNLKGRDREIISNFIEKIDMNTVGVYKEYEFMYEEDGITYNGVIDLILEYKDNIKIVDYKLKNTSDEAYLKQLNGYKKYIERIFKKKTSIYLYSIIDNVLKEI